MRERLGLVIACLAFVAVFVFTYLGGGAEPARETRALAERHPSGLRQQNASPHVFDDQARRPLNRSAQNATASPETRADARRVVSTAFTICHTGGGKDCVVDGDTAWIGGEKVRVADIDAPETHPPRCASEAELGDRATRRLAELLNAGPIELRTPDRDVDRYGRKLRVIVRNGRSLGDQLVVEGLARTWEGRRRPWC